MRRHWAYLKYVVRHRWFVMVECFRHGLIWRGLKHDWSKFLPSEWLPYAGYFYEKDGSKRQIRDKTGYYKPTDTGDAAFDFAWLLHQKRNRHHCQWGILPLDDGGNKILDMPLKDRLEMFCDWRGAGRAQGVENYRDVRPWYEKNKDKMQLSPYTRACTEEMMVPS